MLLPQKYLLLHRTHQIFVLKTGFKNEARSLPISNFQILIKKLLPVLGVVSMVSPREQLTFEMLVSIVVMCICICKRMFRVPSHGGRLFDFL